MTCVYTGALVHFADYGMVCRADLYRVANAIIIRWNPGSVDYDPEMFPHASHVVDLGRAGNDWYREDIAVAVVPENRVSGEFR